MRHEYFSWTIGHLLKLWTSTSKLIAVLKSWLEMTWWGSCAWKENHIYHFYVGNYWLIVVVICSYILQQSQLSESTAKTHSSGLWTEDNVQTQESEKIQSVGWTERPETSSSRYHRGYAVVRLSPQSQGLNELLHCPCGRYIVDIHIDRF